MKVVSRIFICIWAVLLLICVVIILRGLIARSSSRSLPEKAEMHTAGSVAGAKKEAKMSSVTEAGQEAEPLEEPAVPIDLGLISDSTYTSLTDYYQEIVSIITEYHQSSSQILFDMKISGELFGEWYQNNVQQKIDSEQYTLDLDYDQLDDGSVLIHHDLQFKK